jgi:hypothetical protein
MLKTCTKCLLEKDLDDFPKHHRKKDGSASYRSYCKVCTVKQNLDNYHNKGGKEQQKARSFKNNLKKYNITPEDYQRLLEKQNGVCAICYTNKTLRRKVGYNLFVDHCHTTGKVRGLLCHNCNAGLGHFRDSNSLLENAMRYLNENSS